MSESLKTFDIKVDNSSASFTPGARITGHVILELWRTKRFRALKLRFKGRCKVHWSDTDNKFLQYLSACDMLRNDDSLVFDSSNNHGDQETYFRNDIVLHKSQSGDFTELPRGLHTFPFSFILPHNIPNSFEHSYGSVRYTIKAIIDRPWKVDHETKIPFTVENPFKLPLTSIQQGIDDEDIENYSCIVLPCIPNGTMVRRIEMPKTGFTYGDTIKAKISYSNRSDSVDVTRIKLTLQQKLTFRTSSVAKCEDKIIQRTIKNGPFRKYMDVVLGLEVPKVPLSNLEYCKLIDIEYRIVVKFEYSGCHSSTKKKYNILIGINPLKTISSEPISSMPPVSPPTYPKEEIKNDKSELSLKPDLVPENESISAAVSSPNEGLVLPPSTPTNHMAEQLPPLDDPVTKFISFQLANNKCN